MNAKKFLMAIEARDLINSGMSKNEAHRRLNINYITLDRYLKAIKEVEKKFEIRRRNEESITLD